MNVRTIVAGVAVAVGVQAAFFESADAASVVATYTGTVYAGLDTNGLFGSPGANLSGAAYVATYTIDTDPGGYTNNQPSGDYISPEIYNGFKPPVTATIIINGHTQTTAGSYSSSFSVNSPINGAYTSAYTKDAYCIAGGICTVNVISNYVQNFANSSVLDMVPLTNWQVEGVFSFSTYDNNNHIDLVNTYLQLSSPGTIQVAAASVPEPTTWALMLVGFAGLGGALRGRHRRAFAQA